MTIIEQKVNIECQSISTTLGELRGILQQALLMAGDNPDAIVTIHIDKNGKTNISQPETPDKWGNNDPVNDQHGH